MTCLRSLCHVSEVELDTEEMVWTRNEGAVKESMTVCYSETYCDIVCYKTYGLSPVAKMSHKVLNTFCRTCMLDYYLYYWENCFTYFSTKPSCSFKLCVTGNCLCFLSLCTLLYMIQVMSFMLPLDLKTHWTIVFCFKDLLRKWYVKYPWFFIDNEVSKASNEVL